MWNFEILRPKCRTEAGMKFSPPCRILFIVYGRVGRKIQYKSYLWRRYIDDIFIFRERGVDKLKMFIDDLNKTHPTILRLNCITQL